MGRTQKLSYKEMAHAKVTSRIKQLFLLMLTAIIGILVSVTVNAQQSNLSQSHLPKHTKHASSLEKSQTNDLRKGNSDSISKTEQQTSSDVRPVYPAEVRTSLVGNSESRTQEQELVLETNSITSPKVFEHHIIREMVAQHLSQIKNNEVIELAPLRFTVNQDGIASAADLNPFLIAIEFGLQGKTIVIEDPSMGLSQDLKKLMCDQGVPADRITISTTKDSAARATRSVNFKAL
jgi:hypothetical protein